MIAGIQKMTLLDYPGKVACTVFLQGCNFRCPYCHNSDLLPLSGQASMDQQELLSFLQKRRGMLDAVCVSGGEPTLHKGLAALLESIKQLGYAVKLDTNGYRPDVLRTLTNAGLVDYVAMDVKNSPSRYAQTAGLAQMDLSRIEESLRFLITGRVSYELRTTLVAQLHDETSLLEMGRWLESLAAPDKPEALYLQQFTDRESVLFAGLSAPDAEDIRRYAKLLEPYVHNVGVRGIQL